ncbi:hypothetical protein GHT06_013883 [Daphnia sinensis]|uniref:Ionotropic glutamate receptor C-terminal domain-containing protein n=1 Tax=Daphnia sinensis TaxID=1820382 RepID=A0AAD5PTY4_9CRUS|nr:hypothetical protein GHT06_013883 [Daphnia sinensis]
MNRLYWLSYFTALINVAPGNLNLLNGKHLVVGSQVNLISIKFSFVTLVHVSITRNISGHIVQREGVAAETLKVLSQRFNFTYSTLQVNDSYLENDDGFPGVTHYVVKGACDLVIGAIVMTTGRAMLMDFAEGYTYTTVAMLIPMPEPSENASAITKPFQISVWIALLLLIPLTSIAIYFSILPTPWCPATTIRNNDPAMNQRAPLTISQVIYEISQTLLCQGGRLPVMQRNAVYFVLGSWCLAAFVLVSAYNSVLISYVLGSNAKPLASSATELVDKPNIHIVVEKGRAIDIILSAAKDGLYKQLGDKLRSNPKSRCVKKQECTELVKSGSYAYFHSMFVAITIIDDDFKATKKCSLALARKSDPTPGSMSWALPKHSPYVKVFTKGFMELHQAGLVDFWTRTELEKRKHFSYCRKEAEWKQRSTQFDNKTRINLKNVSGAFYVLIMGYILSLVCFFIENASFKIKKLKN